MKIEPSHAVAALLFLLLGLHFLVLGWQEMKRDRARRKKSDT